MNRQRLCTLVCACEIAGFAVAIALSWLGEIIDIPHIAFNFEATPINYVESLCETGMNLVLLTFVLLVTRRLFKKIHHLEGMLAVCSFCKKIRVKDEWVPIETYIQHNSEATFTHSYCPECVRKNFGELFESSEKTEPTIPKSETTAIA
ncbi:MAG: hypothetical protein IPH59_11035 [bacterium]|nr:hypothetical protein [bacterium]